MILFSAFGLRLYNLDLRELNHAEALSYIASQRALTEIAQHREALLDSRPVATYFVLHGWSFLFGNHIFALRFISVWFGILAIALTYRLAICLGYKRRTGLLLAWLMAVSPYALVHSQDAPLLNMSLALTVAMVWFAIEWLQRQRVQYVIGYILFAALALYTHYYAAYILLALYVFVLSRALLFPGLQNSVINLLGPLFVIALLYAPWYERTVSTLPTDPTNGDFSSLYWVFMSGLTQLTMGKLRESTQQTSIIFIESLYFALVIAMHLSASASYRRSLWLLLLYMFIPLIAIWIDASKQGQFGNGSIITVFAPFIILVASGIELLTGKLQNVWPISSKPNLRQPFALPVVVYGGVLSFVLWNATTLLAQYHDEHTARGWSDLATEMRRSAEELPSQSVQFIQLSPNPELIYYLGKDNRLVTLPVDLPDSIALHNTDSFSSNTQRLVFVASGDDLVKLHDLNTLLAGADFTLISIQVIHEWHLLVYDRDSDTDGMNK